MGGVSTTTRLTLWVRAGGRCEYRGCNIPLLGDLLSGNASLNKAYIAHIVAEQPGGPRGDPILSSELADDVDNVMLLCDPHHRLIDRTGMADHPVSLLQAMKLDHEARIEAVTGVAHDQGTHVLLYAAKVGDHDCPANYSAAKLALLPERFPRERHAIQLDMSGVALAEDEAGYWALQRQNLRRQFGVKVRQHIASGDLGHISVFALAPQPLLIELGVLLGEIAEVEVRQLHREPRGWEWRSGARPAEFTVVRPAMTTGTVALKVGLSAPISDERVRAVLGDDASIWSLSTPDPHRDLIQSREDLSRFRAAMRSAFDQIKAVHGEGEAIHLFPAAPLSTAIELGRVWMPKADLPLRLYDQHRESGGFVERFTIGHLDRAEQKEFING